MLELQKVALLKKLIESTRYSHGLDMIGILHPVLVEIISSLNIEAEIVKTFDSKDYTGQGDMGNIQFNDHSVEIIVAGARFQLDLEACNEQIELRAHIIHQLQIKSRQNSVNDGLLIENGADKKTLIIFGSDKKATLYILSANPDLSENSFQINLSHIVQKQIFDH